MATFSLVHGAWSGGWLWDLLRRELEALAHVVHAPDLPCEDITAGVAEHAAAVPAADVVVGYSLGGRSYYPDPTDAARARRRPLPHARASA